VWLPDFRIDHCFSEHPAGSAQGLKEKAGAVHGKPVGDEGGDYRTKRKSFSEAYQCFGDLVCHRSDECYRDHAPNTLKAPDKKTGSPHLTCYFLYFPSHRYQPETNQFLNSAKVVMEVETICFQILLDLFRMGQYPQRMDRISFLLFA
jgi:hypothetical protein